MSLLETLVILAIFSLVVSLATSGLRPSARSQGSTGIVAQIATEISIHRNMALRTNAFVKIDITIVADAIRLPALKTCQVDASPFIQFFKDGTVSAPDLCINNNAETRISFDWLTGRPSLNLGNPP